MKIVNSPFEVCILYCAWALKSLLIYNMRHKMLILYLLAQETFQFSLALLLLCFLL